MFLLLCAGVTLGGEGDPDAVRELGLPSFELSVGSTATAVSEEVTGAVKSGKKRETDPGVKPYLFCQLYL